MYKFSYLKSTNADYIDDLFGRYLADPNSVDESWRYFFEGLELGTEAPPVELANGHAAPTPASAHGLDLGAEAKVAELINGYREYGRLLSDINPLTPPPSSHPTLELAQYGLSDSDLDKSFAAGRLVGLGTAKLREIIALLKATYCGTIAVELGHIQDKKVRSWLEKKLESTRGKPGLDSPTRKMILRRLTEAEGFEKFLHTRYVAQKRFSIEGGETSLPILDGMIETGGELGATEFVIGMAHRGRLNVLTNLFGKKPEYIFTEFEGTYKVNVADGEGDVKYHKGYSADIVTRRGKTVHLSLANNPSHLEFVNAVVEGVCRAKQHQRGDTERSKIVPVLIHGDAAFAGQGVCYETLNLSQLEGYKTGGTLHLVINNQVGFTTDPKDSRSTTYSTDLAKMLDAPIFHVNGDDPDAAWFVAQLSAEYRQTFKADVFIDLVCYRKHGHNEGDEPGYTQPLLYKKIKAHPTTREIYAKRLSQAGVLSNAEADAQVDEWTQKLLAAQAISKKEATHADASVFEGNWKGYRKAATADLFKPVKTAVDKATLLEIAEKINTLPAGFNIHPKLTRFFEARLKAVKDGVGIDWGNGEALAYGSLLIEGHPVRLSGQDAERGTFVHRHSVLNDFETGASYTPLNHIRPDQAQYMVYNSHLSETGVMGFEYGYSLAAPGSLVAWEAQFGDFANGAQVIIDQFIATSESKWYRMTGLVLLLPHGYEGQGPEHSSARLERFLNLCGRENMSVCNLSTPAQFFHVLRRQLKRDFRKPLVVMSPKSLLRNPQAISSLRDFTDASFEEAIDDAEFAGAKAAGVKRVLLCSGKVYYDLVTERASRKRPDVAIVRVEQLYPWPTAKLAAILARYPAAKDLVWVQEEPRNMGAWPYVFATWAGGLDLFQDHAAGRGVQYAGRGIAAAPAVGSPKIHETEQKALLAQAFGE